MKLTVRMQKVILELICLLYILLFVYAAVSKLLDFENFQVKLGQSPLLSAFAGIFAIAVPTIELTIVILFCIPRYRITALFGSFCLMVMFTTYIFLILNYSSYVPCSCGGILEKMDWSEHLIFNLVFVILALVAILLSGFEPTNWFTKMKPPKNTLTLISAATGSFLLILGLHIISENRVHHRNSFVRRFDQHAKPEDKKMNLKVNSYYFAGKANGQIYLGNSTAPLVMTTVDTSLTKSIVNHISLDIMGFGYQSIQVRVLAPYFFVFDGTVPCIFRGKTADWKAVLLKGKVNRFTLAEPLDATTLAVRITSPASASNILGIYTLTDSLKLQVNQELLKKQKDGIFDTDGMLLITDKEKLNYVYYYRNEYLTINKLLQLKKTGRTIDTVTQAKIKVANIANETTMAAPPLVINKFSATYKNLLFINSERIGKYEDRNMLKHASMIDIYDLNSGNYISSMYLYKVDNQTISSFMVYGNHLFTLTGNSLTMLKLDKNITEHYTN